MRKLIVLAFLLVASGAAALEPPLPKFGPEAVPVFEATEYLRQAPAPDYWTLSAFYVPQATTSDCSAAAVVMAMNALRGLPASADQEIVTETALLEMVGNPVWTEQVADEGPGVTFEDLTNYVRESLQDLEMAEARVMAVAPRSDDASALDELRTALAENEASAANVMLIYFNQGVITGDWDGPHISAIGAYDAENDRALIMDVDRNWYVPYWTSTETLLDAMIKPISEEHGVLAGGRGGYILIARS